MLLQLVAAASLPPAMAAAIASCAGAAELSRYDSLCCTIEFQSKHGSVALCENVNRTSQVGKRHWGSAYATVYSANCC